MSEKIIYKVFLVVCLACCVLRADATIPFMKDIGRVITSTLGLAPRCTGCPQRYCDDDPAVIHGYCCGCRKPNDHLPVQCSPFMKCPLNAYELCQQYEYMLHCCC